MARAEPERQQQREIATVTERVPSVPSEEAYADAMSRHGTPEWTDADEQIVERYLRHRTTK